MINKDKYLNNLYPRIRDWKEFKRDDYIETEPGVFIHKRIKERSYIIELLDEYSTWLTKNGYMDTDWKDEEPYAIDEFLKNYKK